MGLGKKLKKLRKSVKKSVKSVATFAKKNPLQAALIVTGVGGVGAAIASSSLGAGAMALAKSKGVTDAKSAIDAAKSLKAQADKAKKSVSAATRYTKPVAKPPTAPSLQNQIGAVPEEKKSDNTALVAGAVVAAKLII